MRPVAKYLLGVIQALDTLISAGNLSNETKAEAHGLKTYFQLFNAVLLLTFWVKVLQCIEDRNIISQSSAISLVQASNIKELEREIAYMHSCWDNFLKEATAVASSLGISTNIEIRLRKRKRFFDEAEEQETEPQSPESLFQDSVSCCNG